MRIGNYVVYNNFRFQIETNLDSGIISVENHNHKIEGLYHRLDRLENLAWFKIRLPNSMRIKVVLDHKEVFRESNVMFDFNGYRPNRVLWQPHRLSDMLKSNRVDEKTALQLRGLREKLAAEGYHGQVLVDAAGECYKHDGAILKVERPDAMIAAFWPPRKHAIPVIEEYLADKGIKAK